MVGVYVGIPCLDVTAYNVNNMMGVSGTVVRDARGGGGYDEP